MRINNYAELALTPTRKIALALIEAGLEAIDTQSVIKNNIVLKEKTLIVKSESFSLEGINRIFVVGVGKCALEAAGALQDILGNLLTDGIVLDVHKGVLRKMKTFGGSHPMPTEENVRATKEIIGLLKETKENDLVLFVISGGASTLLCGPQGITCVDEANILKSLFKSGATIKEINTVRKHLSLARGGYLAKYVFPAQVISLIFSDVVGDNLEIIASGPTIKDTTTIEDAKIVLKKFGLDVAEGLIETPKEDKFFEKTRNILLVSNGDALGAMAKKAGEAGFTSQIRTNCLEGEASEVGRQIVNELHESKPKTILLYGGETTVTIKCAGEGGRNQELALAALSEISAGETVVAFASDGRDNSNSAGAIADKFAADKAREMNLEPREYLKNNDSYNFFKKINASILTGDTGVNVADLIIAIKD